MNLNHANGTRGWSEPLRLVWPSRSDYSTATSAVNGQKNVLDLLGQLVDKSLAISYPGINAETTRFRMLETIRQYVLEKLTDSGEFGPARHRHLAYFLQFTEQIEPGLRGRTQQSRLERLDEELDNLRGALGWALQTDLEAELRLASALRWYWHIRTRRVEGLEWLEKGLAGVGPGAASIRPAVRAKALAAAGMHHTMENELARATVELKESLGIYRELGPGFKADVAFILSWQGNCEWFKKDYPLSNSMCREALALAREGNDPFLTAECLFFLYMTLDDSSHHNTSEGDQNGTLFSHLALGILSWKKGNIQQTVRQVAEASVVARDVNNSYQTVFLLGFQSALDRAGGDEAAAEACLIKALEIARELIPVVSEDLWKMLAQLKAGHQPEKAALGEPRMAALWAEGRAMTFEAAMAYALEGADEG